MAGIRLGVAFASQPVIAAMNKLKLPYNISMLTQRYALDRLKESAGIEREVAEILSERRRLEVELRGLPCVSKIYPSGGNFLLVQFKGVQQTFEALKRYKMKKRALFIDRDGTIIVEPKDTQQIDSLERLEFLPNVISALAAIAQHTDYELVMVTNQDGLGTPSFPEESFWPAQQKMIATLLNEGVCFRDVCIDRSFARDNLPTRKPGTAMLAHYMTGEYDLERSFVVGDRITDIQLAQNLGCQAIMYGEGTQAAAALVSSSWRDIEQFLIAQMRSASVKRTTSETDITVSVALYGAGKVNVRTGLGFFDHMLHLFGVHAGFDLTVDAVGDLHVDEHHLIEDVAITLGEAIRRALGPVVGIQRFGFLLPMDEALATIAVDLSGRSHLEWSVSFVREKIGDVPTEMFKHFFRSLADSLKCALHINVTGENEHHKAEAIFKGVGRALRLGLTRDERLQGVPSTKGVL
jgi:imidazoleglycerol-phosphate dehydratase/histidinol-phosphatase